ncbi:nitrate ABC transporter substrate-binding protein [Verrucomicrobia bacterium LW23]|nr:nitrate ABC transporter substrate-binding protein [Verrucomicrobia bacterium LW23]
MKISLRTLLAGAVSALVLTFSSAHAGEVIRVAIGTQDTTINCATGGPLVRELKLLEKHLPRDGKYKDVTYDIQWQNQPTGAQLNSLYLSNKLDIVQMADFPSILGATAFQNSGGEVRSIYIASLSLGAKGAGNAILVPKDSTVQSLKELKGAKISVPFGSTAHSMLIQALLSVGLDPNKDVTIVTQTPEVGGSALKSKQIDAHANFVPFGELFPFRGFARKIFDGSSTGLPTTHGVQVRSDFAEKYPEIVVAYLKATLEADRLLREQPEELSEKLAGWTGIDPEVYYAFHGPGGIQTRDYTLKPEVRAAIAKAQESLKVLKKIEKEVDLATFVDDRFIRQAAKEFGYDYDTRLKDYAAVPFAGNALDTGKPVSDPTLAGQLWVKGESKVRLYSTPEAAFSALRQLQGAGQTVRVTFVHDRATGNKLFADKVWYVAKDGKLSAFLLKESAEKWSADNGGSVLEFDAALQSVKPVVAAK